MTAERTVDLWALTDLCTPWCMHVVVTLGIPALLADGPVDIVTLAHATGCDAGMLTAVLRHLAGKGVFDEPVPGRFALNGAARDLLNSGARLGLDLDGFGGRMAHAWSTLLTVVRSGAPAYQELYGLPFWEDLDAHPAIGAQFDAIMGPLGHGEPDSEVLLDREWERVRSVVDVGGGTGALLAAIVQAHPHIQGVLVDLPPTVARSASVVKRAGVMGRVTAVGQSFFDPLPAGADLYVLAKILTNWPDREAVALLRRCAEAARPSGRVVVLGGVTPDDAPAGISVETVLLGGRPRTLSEFEPLAREAGLVIDAAGLLPSGRFVVECSPGPRA